MAEVVTRFRLETTQYDSALRDAAAGLQDVIRVSKAAGSSFTNFSQKSVESARSLGGISTGGRTAKERVQELVKVFNSLAREYNSLSDAQKRSDFGQAMGASMQQLKERIKEAKTEMQNMQTQSASTRQETGGLGGVVEQLAGKVGLSSKAFSALGLAGAAAGTALKVAGDAFMQSESNVDNWGRTVKASESVYNSFLNAINNGDFSGFLTGIGKVVQAAKDAYNAIDELNTRMTIINPERAKLQAKQAKLQATIKREGKDSAAGKAAQAQLKALEPQLRKSYMTESQMNKDAFVKEMKLKAKDGGVELSDAEVGALFQTFSSDRLFNQFRAKARGSKGSRMVGASAYSDGYMEDYDTRNKNARLLEIFTDEWRAQHQGYLVSAYNAEATAYNMEKGNARYLTPSGGGGGKGGKGTPKPTPVSKPEEVLPEGSMAAMNKELDELRKAQELVTTTSDWQGYQQQIDTLTEKMSALRGEIKKVAEEQKKGLNIQSSEGLQAWKQMQESQLSGMEYGSKERRDTLANLTDTATFGNLLDFADMRNIEIPQDIKDTLAEKLMEGVNVPDEAFNEFINALNEKLQSAGLEPVKVEFDTGKIEEVPKVAKNATKSWQSAAAAMSQVSGALRSIEDPGAKIMGIIGEAIANVALAFAQATAASSKEGVWAWIAAVAAGTATMISTIASIKSATAGSYAQGGIIPGNSPTGDLLTANVNSGELILNRAQQDSIASQLSENGGREQTLVAEVSGERFLVMLDTVGKRKGRGRVSFTNKL